MDCQTFDSSLLDALYDELDAAVSAAMDEHVAGCAPCASRLARLRRTRELVAPALEAPLPDGLEARILGAAEAAMDAKAAAAPAAHTVTASAPDVRTDDVPTDVAPTDDVPTGKVVSLDDRKKRGGIIAVLSRPQLAVAATLLLVIGGAVLLQTAGSTKREAASVAEERAPSAEEAREPSPAVAQATAAASAIAYAAPPPAAAAPIPGAAATDHEGLAMKAASGRARAAGGAPARSESKPPSEQRHDPPFVAAKALFDAGRYDEALPRFQALAATDPEAELYVARCIANTRGCSAAVAHYDRAATRNAGSESGSRAALEAARCSSRAGQTSAARSRLQRLTNDGFVGGEAQAELAALDAPAPNAPAVKAAKPAATATARPAAPPPNAEMR